MSAVPIKPIFIALAALAGTAQAAPNQPAQPSAEAVKAAEFHLGLIMSALKSPDIPNAMKGGLFGCLYEHPLSDISARVTKVFAANKQLKADDPNTAILVIAKVCGAPVPEPAAAKPTPKANGAGR
jgi:hypothetical protein